MTAQALLDLSGSAERAAASLTGLFLVAALVHALVRGGGRAGPLDAWERALDRRRELLWLALIVAAAAAMRIVGYDRGLTAPYWFSHTATLRVAELLAQGTWWTWVREHLRTYHMTLLEGSAVMMPVALAFQWTLGASLHLPLLIGAAFGIAAVLLAWWLGRTAESRAFGLVFAALIAISPVQIVWSRHGGVWAGAAPHVLLVLALGYVTGRRGNVLLALLTGLITWATLYQYYAARIAIPLAFAALLFGWMNGGASRRRALAVLAIVLATLGGTYAAARPAGLSEVLWPRFVGYVGNRGEQTAIELVSQAATNAWHQVPITLRAHLWANRASSREGSWAHPALPGRDARSPGMEAGGLAFVPIGVLGVLGLLRCLVAPRRRGLWPLFAAAGLAVTALSIMTARRVVVFDAAWCALAANGVLALASMWPMRALPPRLLLWATAIGLAGLGAWSFATIVLLNRVLPPNSGTVIPFGESGYGDGRTCLGCFRAAARWQQDVERGRFVVIFDSDVYRENRTMPGGVPMYAKIAALGAGRPGNYLEFYSLMSNWEGEPPDPRKMYGPEADFATYFAARVKRAKPTAIVWGFIQPTLWERWLADRLEAAGGRRENLPRASLHLLDVGLPLSSEGAPPPEEAAFAIVTPAERIRAALAVIDELADASAPSDNGCVTFVDTGPKGPSGVLATVPVTAGEDEPTWLVGTFADVRLRDYGFPMPTLTGLGYSAPPAVTIHALNRYGEDVIADPATKEIRMERFAVTKSPGLGCAAFVDDRWWGVDPVTGDTFTLPPTRLHLPREPWIGITPWSDHEIALVSANQQVRVIDVRRGIETQRFAAAVWPSRRLRFRECALVAVGDRWFGSFNHLTGMLNVYDHGGAWLETVRAWSRGFNALAIGARGSSVVIGSWEPLRGARLTMRPGCTRAPAPRRRSRFPVEPH